MKAKIVLQILTVSTMSALVLSGCLDKPEVPSAEEVLQQNLDLVNKTQLQTDVAIIDDSLEKWSIVPSIEPNGVRYTVETMGTGPQPGLNDFIIVKYTGTFLKNKEEEFDKNTNGVEFQLKGLILGWQTTLPLLTEGTKATLYIPSGLAYGPSAIRDNDGNVVIPANSNLIFDIEIVNVAK